MCVQTWGILKEKLSGLPIGCLVTSGIAYIFMLSSVALTGLKLWCKSRSDDWERVHMRVNIISYLFGILEFIFAIYIHIRFFIKGEYGKQRKSN